MPALPAPLFLVLLLRRFAGASRARSVRSLRAMLVLAILGSATAAVAAPPELPEFIEAPGDAAASNLLRDTMRMLNAQASAGHTQGTVILLQRVKAFGTPLHGEFGSWTAIAERARAAAARGDFVAMKKACNDCHDAHRESYRNKYGSKSGGGDRNTADEDARPAVAHDRPSAEGTREVAVF